jgi:hypothetical protein
VSRPSSASLPDAAREAAWRALWQRLLAEPPRETDAEANPRTDQELSLEEAE